MIETLRERYRQWKVERRRSKLLSAYAKVGKRLHGLGPGFTPTIFALTRLEEEGLATIREGGEIEWHWPDEDGEAQ